MFISNTTSANNMLQEAKETAAQTQAEAAKGDQQAVRKLASQQAANAARTAQPPAAVVDSDNGRLDVQA